MFTKHITQNSKRFGGLEKIGYTALALTTAAGLINMDQQFKKDIESLQNQNPTKTEMVTTTSDTHLLSGEEREFKGISPVLKNRMNEIMNQNKEANLESLKKLVENLFPESKLITLYSETPNYPGYSLELTFVKGSVDENQVLERLKKVGKVNFHNSDTKSFVANGEDKNYKVLFENNKDQVYTTYEFTIIPNSGNFKKAPSIPTRNPR